MLSQLEAPRAWTLLDAPEPNGPDVDVAGTWLVTLAPEIRDYSPVPEFALRLRSADAGLTGTTKSSLGEAVVEAATVAGDMVYFRQNVGGPLLFWARVDGDRMIGRGENQGGLSFGFSATRRDEG